MEFPQDVEDLLGPLHREGRDDDLFIPGDAVTDGVQELGLAVLEGAVHAVSVGGLHKQVIRVEYLVGVLEDELMVLSQVPGEDDFHGVRSLADPEFQDR